MCKQPDIPIAIASAFTIEKARTAKDILDKNATIAGIPISSTTIAGTSVAATAGFTIQFYKQKSKNRYVQLA